MTDSAFCEMTGEVLHRAGMDPEARACMDDPVLKALYEDIAEHARRQQLRSTAIALPMVCGILSNAEQSPDSRLHQRTRHLAYLKHSMAVCQMLIDLRAPVTKDEEDVLLAASLCHVLPENLHFRNLDEVLNGQFTLDPEVCRIVHLIFFQSNDSGAEGNQYYEGVKGNKLALLIKLADRGNLVQQLYGIAGWSARRYMEETWTFFFPMCIWAKERYPDLVYPINVLMDKMRCLIEAAEILLGRYETRELELTQRILRLQEENASIRAMIRDLQAAKDEK